MSDDTTAFAIPLHQVPGKRKDKTGAVRAKAYRQRKRQKAEKATSAETEPPSSQSLVPAQARTEYLIRPDYPPADGVIAEPAVTPRPTVAPSRHYFAPVLLTTAALALSAVGIAISGWFARSLGSSDVAGWLFLAVGVAADLVALVLPSTPPPGFGRAASGRSRWLAGSSGSLRSSSPLRRASVLRPPTLAT